MDNRGNNRSIGIFAGITLVLIALILAGISLAKNLELGYTQPHQAQTQTTSNNTKNQNNGNQNGGRGTQNNPTQTGGTSTAPSPTQNQPTSTPVATTSPTTSAKVVPSTGPSSNFLIVGLLVSTCVYLVMFIRQTRIVARRRILS